jgi:NAD(P)H-dependent flavin oxidoreductase YrpB (nitropropane dioxygenase family)
MSGAEAIVDLVIKHQVKAVSYGRGPNKQLIKKLKDAGVLCIPTVGAVKHAVKAQDLGADMVVIQGGEGGGHTGAVPTSLLLPQVLDAVKVPVIAAGGFRDGRGLAAALAFGAVGIAMGTRFLMTADSPVPRTTLDRYLKAQVDQVIVSDKLDGLPQRMIMNEVLSDLENASKLGLLWRGLWSGLAFRKLIGASMFDMVKSAWGMARSSDLSLGQTLMAANAPVLIQRSVVEGRPAEGVLPSGQVAGLIDDLPTCKELIDRIVTEAEARLTALNAGRA